MKDYLEKFDKWLENVFKGAPELPKGFRGFLVEAFPWLALLGGIMGVMGIVGALSMGGLAMGMATAFGYHFGWQYWVNIVLLAVMTYFDFKAFNLLKERKMAGWRLSWYMVVLSIVDTVVMLNPMGLVGVVIGFYLLYQVKGEYK